MAKKTDFQIAVDSLLTQIEERKRALEILYSTQAEKPAQPKKRKAKAPAVADEQK